MPSKRAMEIGCSHTGSSFYCFSKLTNEGTTVLRPPSFCFIITIFSHKGRLLSLKVHCHGYTSWLNTIDYRLEPLKIDVRALRNSLVEGY